MSAPATPKFFVEKGSIFAPGWHVRERVRDNYLVSRGCFDEKHDAEEFLAYVLEQEVAERAVSYRGEYAPAAVAGLGETFAPLTRTVDQHTGAVAPAGAIAQAATLEAGLPVANDQLAEIARLKELLTNARIEIDDLALELNKAHELNTCVSKSRGAYQSERDELVDQVEDMQHEVRDAREALTRVAELEEELEELAGRDAAVNAEAEAGEDDPC